MPAMSKPLVIVSLIYHCAHVSVFAVPCKVPKLCSQVSASAMQPAGLRSSKNCQNAAILAVHTVPAFRSDGHTR